MSRLGIEQLSVFGLHPVKYVELAAELGCGHISTGLQPTPCNPHNYEPWSLRGDLALRRDFTAAARDHGVSISLCDGFVIMPGRQARDYAADLDVVAELGIKRINTLSMADDLQWSLDEFGALVEMARARSLNVTLEYSPVHCVGNLSGAIAAIRHVGQANFGLLIDTMHFCRSGSKAADLATVDPSLIAYIQLCDAPMQTKGDYMEEARFERLPPGEGELPLLDILAAAPRDVIVSLEIPQRAAAEAGAGPRARLGHCVSLAMTLLSQLNERDSAA